MAPQIRQTGTEKIQHVVLIDQCVSLPLLKAVAPQKTKCPLLGLRVPYMVDERIVGILPHHGIDIRRTTARQLHLPIPREHVRAQRRARAVQHHPEAGDVRYQSRLLRNLPDGALLLFLLRRIIWHERHHLVDAERHDMRAHLTILLVGPAGTMGNDRSVIQHRKRRLHRIAGRTRQLSADDVLHVIPLRAQHVLMLDEIERLIEHLRAAPGDQKLICEIGRRHDAFTI